MTWNWKENNKQKHQFKSYYCLDCKQRKPCHLLSNSKCCACYFQNEEERTEEYSDYQQVYQRKKQERKDHIQQLQILKSYSGCKQCGSKDADGYSLYENNKLVCQPCRMKKEGGASGSVSFLERQKWYKRYWKIDLGEWLENYGCLPVNSNCAEKWLKDRNHLNNCNCLEKETQNLVDLFTGSLRESKEKLKDCKCETSNKPRTPFYDNANYGYTYCEKCETNIKGAGKMGIIKNRNDPKFWGLNIEEKVLCLNCLQKFQEQMPISKRYTLNKYLKRGY